MCNEIILSPFKLRCDVLQIFMQGKIFIFTFSVFIRRFRRFIYLKETFLRLGNLILQKRSVPFSMGKSAFNVFGSFL